jgi:hypothetical protein
LRRFGRPAAAIEPLAPRLGLAERPAEARSAALDLVFAR